ncbi:hypothetical protein HK105_203436 [Polyrhizophydium stewartii]|uniref:Uncharacterized protein n=1 Tax=Polyrhizophydium stewartii TaxID=2732419 RepID=A0ABR4NBT6_9FUNG|nr:hypothetical protein HK105_000222 [Polyrhizophydium stewartii]
MPSTHFTQSRSAWLPDARAADRRSAQAVFAEHLAEIMNRIARQPVKEHPSHPPLRLVRRRQPSHVGELSEIERRQLIAAGRLYDGVDAPVEARLRPAGESSLPTSLGGFVEVWDVVDATPARESREGDDAVWFDGNGDPVHMGIVSGHWAARTHRGQGSPAADRVLYTAWLLMSDSGAFFRAGTLDLVASVCQCEVQADCDLGSPEATQDMETALQDAYNRSFLRQTAA